jgi:hypothetical protein
MKKETKDDIAHRRMTIIMELELKLSEIKESAHNEKLSRYHTRDKVEMLLKTINLLDKFDYAVNEIFPKQEG